MDEHEVRAAIDTALNAYALGMDLRDERRFLEAWHPTGTWSINVAVGTGELNGTGYEEITSVLHDLWDLEQLVMHATTNHHIEIEDENRATGQSHAVVLGVTQEGKFFIDCCVYPSDRYELADGSWRLVYRRVEIGAHVEFDKATAPVQLFKGAAGAFGPCSR